MAYRDFKDLTRRTASDKILCEKVFNSAKIGKYNGYQRNLASLVYKCFGKKSLDGAVKSETMQNQQLAEVLHKPNIRKFEKRKVYASFKDNIWVLILML